MIEIKNRWLFSYVLLFFVVLCNCMEAEALVLDRVVAVIDKEVITWGELYRAMEFDMRDEIKDLKGPARAAFISKHEREFLDTLIEIKVQLMYAEGRNIGVSKAEVDAAIDDIRRKYSLSEQEFFGTLKKEGFSVEEYKKRLSEQILLSKLGASEISNKVIVTENEITERLKNQKGSVAVSSQYRIRLIVVSKPADTDKDKIAGEGLALKKKAEDIYSKLLAGEDFGKLAAKFSDGPNTSNGGDIGFIRKEEMDKDFLTVVEQLKEGQFSKIFVTDKGINIIQLIEKKAVDTETQVRDELRRELFAEKSKRAFKDWIKSLKEKRFIKVML
ncbi:PpiC-type peptidyl-prolyl cis-trans isomerase [Candidatus Magnetobacterium bavaricum]|uniref:PpiC-type peptidyl-prolyl cis-trans isomerase n=1 Tax=Candidatus Magnetobacterium bavaricum TaxID=29290 RepID=A0A0F3GI96_9BACT|nr:PpiC-type peptidyl-prolyl cis-trans isomerase [Candidatus Magnetobacterium bavaricum]